MKFECENCGSKKVYLSRIDTYICVKCNEWKESDCGDVNCHFCTDRGVTPFDNKYLSLINNIFDLIFDAEKDEKDLDKVFAIYDIFINFFKYDIYISGVEDIYDFHIEILESIIFFFRGLGTRESFSSEEEIQIINNLNTLLSK